MGDERRSTGRRGEEIAAEYLRKRGYQIHETNFRCSLGELDIVASERGTLVFVEVRARRGVVNSEELVPPRKQRKVHQVASAYLQARYGGAAVDVEGRGRYRSGAKPAAQGGEPPIRTRRPGDLPPCRIDVVLIGLAADGSARQIELIRDAIRES